VSRSPRKAARPIRGFIYAVLIHIVFGALIGVSLWFQPQVIEPLPGKPMQAKAIDLAAIERAKAEKKRKATEKKKAAEKKKEKEALKKKDAKAEKKRKATEKKKAAEKKKKEAALKKKKAETEKKRKATEKKKAAEKKKKEEALKKKKAEAEKKRKATEKKKAAEKKKEKEALKKKEEALKKKKAAEAKKKSEAEKKRKAAEEKAREAAETQAQLERDEQEAVSAFGALAWAIQQQVSSNWSEPGDFSGMSVSFLVKVDRDGNVISVTITKESGDARLDESAENAIFKASPLPFPTEPRYYEYLKEFNFVFKP
jgi:colicin import membrane protein